MSKKVITVSDWLVRGIVGFSGALEIFAAMYIVRNGHNVLLEMALILSGFILVVGSVGFVSWTPDKE